MAYSEHYIESKDIHVFPCAYRSQVDSTTIYDPEARLNTEKNITNIGINNFKNKDGENSYIISFEDVPTPILKCVIDGYYFEIKNKFLVDLNTLYIYATRKTISGDNKTEVLGSFESGTDNNLDKKDTTDNKYYFTGLYFGDSAPTTIVPTASLKLYDATNGTRYDNFLPKINAGNYSDNTAVTMGTGTTANKTNLLSIGAYNSDPANNDLFIIGNGESDTVKSNALEVNKNFIKIDVKATTTKDIEVLGSGSSSVVKLDTTGSITAKNIDIEGAASVPVLNVASVATIKKINVEASNSNGITFQNNNADKASIVYDATEECFKFLFK